MVYVTGFVGYECEDIVLYLAKMMVLTGKKVLISDRTEHQTLAGMFFNVTSESQEMAEKTMEYEGIHITAETANMGEYDSVLMLFGYRLRNPKLFECETLVMVSDGYPAHASVLKSIGSWERRQYLLFRNIVPAKYAEEYLAAESGAEPEECIYIPLAESDIRLRNGMGADERLVLRRLSTGMKRGILELFCRLFSESSPKEIGRLIKKS